MPECRGCHQDWNSGNPVKVTWDDGRDEEFFLCDLCTGLKCHRCGRLVAEIPKDKPRGHALVKFLTVTLQRPDGQQKLDFCSEECLVGWVIDAATPEQLPKLREVLQRRPSDGSNG